MTRMLRSLCLALPKRHFSCSLGARVSGLQLIKLSITICLDAVWESFPFFHKRRLLLLSPSSILPGWTLMLPSHHPVAYTPATSACQAWCFADENMPSHFSLGKWVSLFGCWLAGDFWSHKRLLACSSEAAARPSLSAVSAGWLLTSSCGWSLASLIVLYDFLHLR